MDERNEIAVEDLTSRQLEVVLLVGRDGLNYQKAALKLRHLHHPSVHISARTVRHYCEEVRDLVAPTMSPLRAVIWFYHRRAAEIEALAA